MKKLALIIGGALLFGLVSGGTMIGIKRAAEKAGIIEEETEKNGSDEETIPQIPGQNESGNENSSASGSKENSQEGSSSGSSTKDSDTSLSAFQSDGDRDGTVDDVARNSMSSVVAITNMMRYRQNGFSIFGNYQDYETEVPASGSGVIIGEDDDEFLIVTNNHVVTDSNSLSVNFLDEGTAVDALVKGTDATRDIAVISVKKEDIPDDIKNRLSIAVIGDSDLLEVGDQVVAIGNALGYGQSVTTGIISAKNRSLKTSDGGADGLLQTDAAINPGNSGGALLNMNGELIGINVAKYSDTSVEGMCYAIPSNAAKEVIANLSTLSAREDVPENERGYLGVQVKNIDSQTAEAFDMPQGVFIYRFTEGSSAENSALQEKDIIVAFDNQGVSSYDDLAALLRKYREGESVVVKVMRPNGSKYDELDVTVTLGSYETSSENGKYAPKGSNGSNGSSSDGDIQNGQDPFRKQDGNNDADPFSRNDGSQNGSDSQPGSNNGSDSSNGSASNDGSQNGSANDQNADDLFRQFEEFFNQYQR